MSTARIRPPRPDAGFSIVETMVALFVFSVAAVALIQMQTQSVDTFSAVETRALASIVAENQLVDTMAKHSAPSLGVQEGEADLGGRQWRWRLEIMSTADPSTLRLKSQVFPADDRNPAADVSAYMVVEGVS
jgi:general secretion pathway protein I